MEDTHRTEKLKRLQRDIQYSQSYEALVEEVKR